MAENLINKMGTKSVAGAALLMGLLLFGFRVGHALWPKAPARKLAETSVIGPAPFEGELGTMKLAPVASAAAAAAPGSSEKVSSPAKENVSATSAAPVMKPVIKLEPAAKKMRKTVVPASLPPPQVQIAGVSSPPILPPVPLRWILKWITSSPRQSSPSG